MERPKPSKRLSLPVPAALPVLPLTRSDWKRAIGEIKRLHMGRKYRACASRCNEILDNIKDKSVVEPVFLIYLHFYAATSMEMSARPQPLASSLRTSLLLQARAHFDSAASLITAAEESVIKKRRPSSISSLRSSSCHTPSDSISSGNWTPDTPMSSPTNSISSLSDLSITANSPKKRVKKVSFSLPKDHHFQIPSPIIRPDSPTLGFDDEYFHAGTARQELPQLPIPKPKFFQEVEIPLQPVPELPLQTVPEIPETESIEQLFSSMHENFLLTRSVNRYCDHLSALRTQLARHSANVEEMLSSRGGPQSSSLSDSLAAKSGSGRHSAMAESDVRALDLQARIERLRKNGWQRKRFDARRYEELCETVLSEIALSPSPIAPRRASWQV